MEQQHGRGAQRAHLAGARVVGVDAAEQDDALVRVERAHERRSSTGLRDREGTIAGDLDLGLGAEDLQVARLERHARGELDPPHRALGRRFGLVTATRGLRPGSVGDDQRGRHGAPPAPRRVPEPSRGSDGHACERCNHGSLLGRRYISTIGPRERASRVDSYPRDPATVPRWLVRRRPPTRRREASLGVSRVSVHETRCTSQLKQRCEPAIAR